MNQGVFQLRLPREALATALSRRVMMPAAVAVLATAALTGCDFNKTSSDDPSTSGPANAAPSSSAPSNAAPSSAAPSNAAPSSDAPSTAGPGDTDPTASVRVGWDADARAYRGQLGKRIVFKCPAQGTLSTVWGTDVYSDDSSICTAAVHAGLISLDDGGVVKITILAGAQSYHGSTREGVSTLDYDSWEGSFKFGAP